MGQEVTKGGYPDMGNGLYSLNLSYKEWLEFQLDQRQHKNFLEQITILIFTILVAGLVFPTFTIVLAGIHFVGRILYTLGYRVSPKARMIGAPFVMLSSGVLIFSAIFAAWKLTGFVKDSKTIWSL